jgi:tetratricopeptide (TPR) repeat protein
MKHAKARLVLVTLLLGMATLAWTADSEPPETSPEEKREELIVRRFLTVLEKNPRRGTALDRIYGHHVERGSLDKIVGQYSERTKKDPTDGTAWMVIGLLESQRGRDARAVEAFRQAEKHLPDNALASYYLGQSLVLVGRPEQAALAFERAIERKPNRADLLDIFQALGRVHQRAQHTEKALAAWGRLEKLFPDDRRVQEQIASTLAEEGQYAEALPRFEKLAKSGDDSYQQATFRMEAAELKVRLKQTDKALADFEELLTQLNPDSWLHREVRRKIEDVFLRSDDQAGLARYYEKWLGKNAEDVEVMARLARTLATQGRSPDSRKWLEKALEKASTRRDIRQTLIDQLVFEQKYAEAATQYEAMDKADPNNPDTLRDWGKVLLRDSARPEAERKKAALAVWKRLLDKRPKDPVTAAQVADLMRSANLVEDAIALYQRAIELAPTSPQYREYLGEYYHSLKRRDDALAAWKPMASRKNRTAKNLSRLGEVLAGFGYRKEALAAFADAVSLEKDDFNLLLRYADLLHQADRHDDALAQLDAAGKLASTTDEREQVLEQQIKVYQDTESLVQRADALHRDLEAGKNATAERWHRLARYYEAGRQMAEATEAIGKAVDLDRKSIPILASAARIHENGGNLLLAAQTNRRLAAVDRRLRTEYLTAVAKLEARLGRREEALQAGRDLIAAAPGNPEHYKFFADLCFQLGESDEGLESLRRCVRANPSEPDGLLTLANALVERLRTGEAIELYWRAFEKTTEMDGRLGIVARLTELYLQNNQLDRLLERLERERREADKQRELTMCIAQVYQSAGDFGTSRQQLERLLTENARDPQLLGQLSQLAESEGDASLAMKYQRQLVQAAPSSHDGKLRLAQLLVQAGEAEEAASIWVKLVADEPDPHRNLEVIDSLLKHNKYDTALAVTSRMLARKPGDWELLYREGMALGSLEKTSDAARRFRALLDLHNDDDEPNAATRANKGKRPRLKLSAKQNPNVNQPPPMQTSQTTFQADPVPPEQRTQWETLWHMRAWTGLEPRMGMWASSQQQVWTPADFGQARMAALGWLLGFAQKEGKSDVFIKEHRPAANAGPRALWDWFYLQVLRLDKREAYEVSRKLARTPDPAAQWIYLNALVDRTTTAGRPSYGSRMNMGVDAAPPLPEDQIQAVLVSYDRLRSQKPQWLTSTVLINVVTELKRARRAKDEERVYKQAVAAANDVNTVGQVLGMAGARGDMDSVLDLFARLEKLQGPQRASATTSPPTRQAASALGHAMKARADARAFDDIIRLFEVYLAAHQRVQRGAGRVLPRSGLPSNNTTYYTIWLGPFPRNTYLDYPRPNEHFDAGAIQLLRNAFELYKARDVVSDLLSHFQKRLAKAPRAEQFALRLILGYLHWWAQERDQALTELAAASELRPGDSELRLELADLRERNNEPEDALAVLDSLTPLDHTTMQRREMAALRLAVRTGNVERARQAADRLFGLRLDAETQVKLAAQMHQLGMHEHAETVLGRAQRQAGNRTAALISLMQQYQGQDKTDLAVQIARQLLRKGPSTNYSPYNYYRADGRDEAIQVLARSGKLKEMIERAEAQLKNSPRSLQLHQALLDYYRADGNKDKVKDVAKRMVAIRPDDGKLRYQLGQQLHQMGDAAAAVEHYRVAIKKEPVLLSYSWWEMQSAFAQADKEKELPELLEEIDLKQLAGNYWGILNTVQPLLASEKTREQGLKLFRKMWKAYPDERAGLMGSLYQDDVWRLPEIYDYAREAVLPQKEGSIDPWRGSDEFSSIGPNGRVIGLVTRLLEVARKQNRLDTLAKEVEQKLAKHPHWSAGKALAAILELQRGRPERARRVWKELLADKKDPMPTWAYLILGQELEHYGAVEDLVIETYQRGLQDARLQGWNMQYDYGPLRRLVVLYREAGKRDKAREMALRSIRDSVDRFDPGYDAYWRINSSTQVANDLLEMGYPLDALRLYNELLQDEEVFTMAQNWGGWGQRQNVEQSMQSALKKLTPETLPATMRELLTPRTPALPPPAQALDLILVLQPRELPDAAIISIMEKALRAANKTSSLREDIRKRLAALVADHPEDISVQTTAALAALICDGPEKAEEAVQRLVRLVESRPLEKLPEGRRANARQRADAAPQQGLWLVARECLRHKRLRAAGEQLADRALEAARRQREMHFAVALLREWGQIETDRGDGAAAERRWAQMLELVLPPPARGKQQGRRAAGFIPAGILVADAAPRPVVVPAPAVPAPPTKAAPPAGQRSLAPLVSIEQFTSAAQVATLAAERKMLALSRKAVRQALSGGPPVPAPEGAEQRRFIRFVGQPGGGNEGGAGQFDSQVESSVRDLVGRWRERGMAAADVYDTLVELVLPKARLGEVFVYAQPVGYSFQGGMYYPGQSQGAFSRHPHSIGALLAETAVRAGKVDDLRRRTAARQDKPLGELAARVLLTQLALAAGDDARTTAMLKDLDGRLKKERLQNTATLVCHVALPALERKELAATALEALQRAADNFASTNADDQAVGLLLLLARHHFEHSAADKGKDLLKKVRDKAATGAARRGGESYRLQVMQRVAQEAIRAELLTDVLEVLGMAADLPREQRGQLQVNAHLLAAFDRRLAARPARERYNLLKPWTLPAPGRSSVRLLAAFVPGESVPPVFGKITGRPAGVFSSADLLIEAARQQGKLDECAAEMRKLADKKVENARLLHALLRLAAGQGDEALPLLRERVAELRKQLATPPEPEQPRYYYPGMRERQTGVEWSDYLLARACLADAKHADVGEQMASLLAALAERHHAVDFLVHLRSDLARSRAGRLAAGTAVPHEPGLPHWHPAAHADGAGRAQGLLPSWWVAHEGHVAHLGGPQYEYLVTDYPLTGTFELSVDAYQGGVGYAGLVFEPAPSAAGPQNPGQTAASPAVWPVGHHDQLPRPGPSLRPDDFTRLTLQVSPERVRCLVDGHLFYEETEPAPTSPWLALFSARDRQGVFRNASLRGKLEIPREVALSHADRLDGWVCGFYNESQPPRISKKAEPVEDQAPQPQQKDPVYDWRARDGEILGRRNADANAAGAIPSRLSYFRPLRPGETLRYQFFYQPGEVHVCPALDRLVFLLEPERVRLHWMNEADGDDWTGLPIDNAADDSAAKTSDKPLPLRPDAWNTLSLSLTAEGVQLTLNDVRVYERRLEPDNDRTFSLFHYKDRTSVRVRGVVLTGDWPEKVPAGVLADPLGRPTSKLNAAARRALVGDKFFLLRAPDILDRVRSLPREERYARLLDWVLPGEEHNVFHLSGHFGTGGKLEAPALDLVALATELGKLDELARRVEQADSKADARGRLALLAVVRAAQKRDTDAAGLLKELRPLLTHLPLDAPVWQRWPDYIAAAGVLERAELRPPARALLGEMIRQLEEAAGKEAPAPDRPRWLRQVRHLLARLELRSLPGGDRIVFGTSPRLRSWVPVAHEQAELSGTGAPLGHWEARDGTVSHYPGHEQDHLYLRMPLVGNFEVEGEYTAGGVQLAYGGLRIELKKDGKSYDVVSFGRRLRTERLTPPLPAQEWRRLRLVAKDGTWTVYLAERKLCEEPLAQTADPWLMIHADGPGSVRGLRLKGTPTVPERLILTAHSDLTGWYSYQGDPPSGTTAWEKQGEEIFSRSTRPGTNRRFYRNTPSPSETASEERALFYHRPVLEDGDIEYEFYYDPESCHAAPALGRLVFLLDPAGVRIHHLTDGIHDRTGAAPDNATTERDNRRGPARLPLKPLGWNRMKVELRGDTVRLVLGGVEVYERKLGAADGRSFGLFHYADAGDLRVRNVTYRGQWPRQVPAEMLAGEAAQ